MKFLHHEKLDHVPFSTIDLEEYLPELDKLITLSKQRIEEIKSESKPNFENTIIKLEESAKELGLLAGIFFNLNSAETSDRMQEIARDFSAKLTKYDNDVNLDGELFQKLKSVYDQKDSLDLDQESLRVLEKHYDDFSRNGALLNEDKKEQLRSLDEKLAQTSLSFGENLLSETKAYELFLSEEEVKGLPEGIKEAFKEAAAEKGQEGKYLVNLDYPSYVPFMQYAQNRELREKLYRARMSLCFNESETSNINNIKELVQLRDQRARLLGYSNHAEFTLKKRMAEKEEKVFSFLEELKLKALPKAKEELEELKAFAKNNGFEGVLQRWDYSFWSEKLKKEKLSLDTELLRPYFKLENVVDGVFQVANKLYGLTFKKDESVDVYHEDVTAYRVHGENDEYVGLFYADFFPRKGKRGGAWMTSYKEQFQKGGEDHRPHISIVCNFTKPSKTKPSLLNFEEVTTLFHEFGHALHGLLTKCRYRSLSGTNVFWDFVELPSQVLENWCFEKECLSLFAKHYETGELISDETIERMQGLRTFHEGLATMRQVGFATVDMNWHTKGAGVEDLGAFEKSVMDEMDVFPKVDGTNFSCSFGHIFQGGYSAGYYSYKWAEVLDADAFEAFKENGLFDSKTAKLFKENVLESGNKKHPMDLYVAFRGHEPKVDALLRRGGLI